MARASSDSCDARKTRLSQPSLRRPAARHGTPARAKFRRLAGIADVFFGESNVGEHGHAHLMLLRRHDREAGYALYAVAPCM
jgi:hypothetical protein